MKYPGKKKSARTGMRASLPLLLLVLAIVGSVLIIYSTPVLTIEKRTSGNLTFIDGAGNQISGTIEISMIGAPPGRKDNVNSISWSNAPNAWIYFDAHETKSVSINLRISGDSPNGMVSLEDHGAAMPGSVGVPMPGVPVKYVELHSSGVSFAEADISIYYTDAELKGLDETSLVIYGYDGGAWTELPTRVDAAKNVVSAAVVTLSVFAVSARASEGIEIRDTRGMPVTSQVKTYDEARTLKKEEKTSTLSSANIPDGGELEVDALASRNVAVRLKVKAINKGEIVLDDFGKNNPVSVPLPGKVVKFVEIGAPGILFSSANITIWYTDAELNGGSESELKIYHWNGASWDALPTTLDAMNNTLTATTTSLSPFGVAGSVTYRWIPDTGTTVATGVTTDWGTCGAKPTSYSKTLLTDSTTSGCNSDSITSSNTDPNPMVEMFFNTAYTVDTNVKGNWYYGRINTGGSAATTYRFYLIYVFPNGTIAALPGTGSVTASGNTDQNYNVSLTAINGTVPKDARLGLRITKSVTSTTRVLWFGDTAGIGSVASGYFSITDTPPVSNLTVQGNIRDKDNNPLNVSITAYDADGNVIYSDANTSFNWSDIPQGGYLQFDALSLKNVSAKFKLSANSTGSTIILDKYSSNPEPENPSDTAIKYVNVSASNLSYSGVEIRMSYTDSEISGLSESSLKIYHYKNSTWNLLPTSVDTAGNILTASTTSLSTFTEIAANLSYTVIVRTDKAVYLMDPYNWVYVSGNANWIGGHARNVTINAMVTDPYGRLVPNDLYPSEPAVRYRVINATGIEVVNSTMTKVRTGFYNATFQINETNLGGTKANYSTGSLPKNYTIYINATISSKEANTSANFKVNRWGCDQYGTDTTSCHYPVSWSTHSGTWSEMLGEEITGSAYFNISTLSDANWTHAPPYIYNNNGKHETTLMSFGGCSSDCHRSASSPVICTDCHRTLVYGAHTRVASPGSPWPNCANASCHGRLNSSTSSINRVNRSFPNCSSCHPISYRDNFTATSQNLTISVVPQWLNTATGIPRDIAVHPNPGNAEVNCTFCHNSFHNLYNQSRVLSCFDCHQVAANYSTHNGTLSPLTGVNCTSCHNNTPNKIDIHNTTTPLCSQCHFNVSHSNDPGAGKKWNSTVGYWMSGTNASAQRSSCKYCHGDSVHSAIALGRPSLWRGNNVVNSTIGNTTWCSSCHYQGYASGTNTYNDMVSTFTGDSLLVPPEISANAAYGANQSIYEYTNHSLYTSFYSNLNDSACNRCHGYNYGFTTITRLVHNQSRVGGANCVDCHDLGGIALVSRVNVTAANDNNEIHKNLNSGASASNGTAYYANNKRCWFCHGDDGAEPTTLNAHPSRYKTPRRCPDCHLPLSMGGNNHNNGLTGCNCHFNIPYPLRSHLWNGTNIFTPAVTTCYDCHNKSEMLIPAYDPGNGSGAVYGGLNGGNNSASHYGRKRADLRIGISTNCSYCHQNTSTVFATAMVNSSNNASIANHSLRYNSSTPSCTSSQCHSTGWLHNDTLTKPNLTLPNSSYCLSCHGSNGTGSTNYSGAVTEIKEKHNNTINCSECHLNTSKDVHPMKYLQPNASYNTSNSTAVNCINCHQNLTVYPNLTRTPPKIPNPMHHSDNASNGTLWNATAYWTPGSPLTACIYCHNDTKHNATALGRPANWKGNNGVGSEISTGNWCTGCHYQGYSSGAKNYSDMSSSFISAGLAVPPEITNGTYAPYNFSRYYNHSLNDYSDATCRLCHGVDISLSDNITSFVHNITWGSCTSCHYSFEAMNNTTKPEMFVDQGMYNTSLHRSLTCSNCHTQGHRNIGARKACEDCHAVQTDPITDKDRHNITSKPSTYYYNSVNVVNITTCTTCHSGTLYNTSIATYGYGKSKDCDYCHTYPDKYYE